MEQTVLSINDDKMTTRGELIEYPAELIGGRNLLRNFKDSNWSSLTGSDVTVVSPYEFIRESPYVAHYSKTNVYIEGGDTFTFSGRIGGLLTIYEYNSEDARTRTVVAYQNIQKITFTTLPQTVRLGIILSVFGLPDGEYSFSNVKLERGTIPTDWTPAPEDLGLSYHNWVTEFKPSISENGILAPEFDESGVLSFSINRTTAQEFIENHNL